MRLAKRVLLILLALLVVLPAPLLYFGYAQPRLHGVVMETVKPQFSWAGFADGSFQTAYANWFNQRFALRDLFIRLNNQLYYSVFDKSYMGDVLIGKQRQLYGRGYVDEYCGIRLPLPEPEQQELVRRMASVQQLLQQRGITFVVLVTPSKPDVVPQDLPDDYCNGRTRHPRNYDRMLPLMQAAGIQVVDTQQLILQQQRAGEWPLFPRGGLHWNSLGASGAVNALLERIAQLRGLPAGGLQLQSVTLGDRPIGEDKDLASVLNLWRPDDRYPIPLPQFAVGQPDAVKPLSMFMVGGSFSWLPLELIAQHRLLDLVNFHFYYRGQQVVYVDGRWRKVAANTDITQLDYANYVLRHDVVGLEINVEAFSYPHAKDFLHDLEYNLMNKTAKTVPAASVASPRSTLGPGWYDAEVAQGVERRWMDGEASIVLFADAAREAALQFQATSFFRPRNCQVYLNDRLVGETVVPAGAMPQFSWRLALRQGANRLRIVTTPGGETPASVTDSQDQRVLALLLQELRIRYR